MPLPSLPRPALVLGALLALTACASSAPEVHDPHAHHAATHAPATDSGSTMGATPGQAGLHPQTPDTGLAQVAAIHGAAGPWAVAGYRMGRFALARLGLPPQSFDLEVIHRGPHEVQYSCIADGAAAATGASVGKLNLSLENAAAADLATVYRRKSTGATITLRPTSAFEARFLDVPPEKIPDAGRTVMQLPEKEIFEEVPRSSP